MSMHIESLGETDLHLYLPLQNKGFICNPEYVCRSVTTSMTGEVTEDSPHPSCKAILPYFWLPRSSVSGRSHLQGRRVEPVTVNLSFAWECGNWIFLCSNKEGLRLPAITVRYICCVLYYRSKWTTSSRDPFSSFHH